MAKTLRKKTHNKTRKNISNSSSLANFQKEITVVFLEMLMMVKLYHWKTTSYSTHKATDELYSSLNEHIDTFIEVLLGKSDVRTNLMSHKTIKLMDLNSVDSLKREILAFKSYLVNLDKSTALKSMSNSDLFNIRDEILADLNKFLYLLTLN